ncbi:HD-GYP domain-containing protein [Ureibacillus sinduriensis]|uniref:Diguanylate cyclase n=1 Tax=Ureibacillus sinduriensis BLB-1 = JCM 15800 TaxID=1384057 RepID=A0A0A3HVI2_9BACL|nr:HD-GYP domain-containing protein [Ureibacillus sinduriensis]KGR74288.1 diguanylate cyclase [Ureibacillus sinduriensis BLB-1 = JCM 15800]
MLKELFYRPLYNPIYFRYGFFFVLALSVILNSFILHGESIFYILYILSVIFLGIGFYDKSIWFLTLLTFFTVTCRYLLIPDSNSNLGIFLIHLITYLLITLISAGLMKYAQKVEADNLELTVALSNTLDSRDHYTLHHSENVAIYSVQIAEKMKLSKVNCEIIRKGALLHDIGKIGIPEHILGKEGKLTEDEYTIIKSHPTLGHNMLKHIGDFHKNGVLDIVLYHHERFDGKGYPSGLKGQQIPLFARIVAIADTYDAITTKRVYREGYDLEYALEEIRKNKGLQFDPEIVDVFLSLFEQE